MNIETLAVHAGHTIDPTTGAVTAPIHLSTTFEREIDGTYPRGYMYTRNSNPNRDALERGVALLEGGAAAAAFASGSAATTAIFQSLSPGDHVIADADAYYGTTRLLRELFLRWGLEATFVDMSDLAAVGKALNPKTKLAWIETPSNPLLKIVDIAAVTKMVSEAGAVTVCDNTWGPIIQRPLDLGASLVMHSTTKYFGGHCDVLGGIIVTKAEDEFFERIRVAQVSVWSGSLCLRLLACSARHANASVAHARTLGKCDESREVPERSPTRENDILSRPDGSSRARHCSQADDRVWWNAFF